MHPALEMFTILDVQFEGRRLAKIQLKAKQLMCLFLMLTSVLAGFSFLPRTNAVMQVFSVTPASGNVGTNVTLTANLTTANGQYNVTFDGVILVVGTATGNDVNASFLVPETALGTHNVTVIDASNPNENATRLFGVNTAYSMNVTVPTPPVQLQEGDSVPIFLSVTGGNSSTTFGVTFSVETPANVTYPSETLNITTSALGSGNGTLTYPGGFKPSGNTNASTGYVGSYSVSASVTSASVTITPQTFVVGLTNSTEYHRMQTVNIKAVSYTQNENVTLTVSGNGIQNSVNLTADSAGVISYENWTVPVNASVGTYGVNIVSVSGQTVKAPPDSQNFTVPGFSYNVTARNLANDTVPNVLVSALENGTSVNNQTTDSNGLAVLMLEIGNYTLQGYSESVRVGEGEFEVNEAEATRVHVLVLNLTNLNIRVVAVVNGAEIGIPEATVYLTPENVTLTTDINGSVVAHSLLPNGTYTLNASRYDTQFNATATPAAGLKVNGSLVPFYPFTIRCPSFTLQINASKADEQPFGNALVEAKELAGGIYFDGNTDSNGTVFFTAPFGQYDVEIHDSNAGRKLNSTVVSLFQDKNVTVQCDLYDLSISVNVTDYFGQPFPNLNVTLQGMNITLQGEGFESLSDRTQADGTVTFNHLVGDSFSIMVYLSDQGSPAVVEGLHVSGSTEVPIKMNRYVLLAGLAVETSQLAIAIVIVLSVLLVLSLEIYRRRRNKSQKTDS
jgi:hypothetical protein